jgi:nitroreductase
MNPEDLYQAIFRRKSVRNYDSSNLSLETLQEMEDCLSSLTPLYPDIKTEFKIVPGDQIKTRMMKRSPRYILAFSEKKEGNLVNVGYMLQQMDLYLSWRGIGTCWQGIPQPKKEALATSSLNYDILLTMGKPQEVLYREDVGEFRRKPLKEITDITGADDLLEPVRLAPSSTNSQPWYITGTKELMHFYCRKPGRLKSLFVGRFNQMDMGIALYHLKLSAEHFKKKVEFFKDEVAVQYGPDGYYYVQSVKVEG